MPLEAVAIRDATAADVPAIAMIYAREVETGIATFEDIAPSEAEMAARMAKLHTLGLPYLVAESGGKIVGYAYAGPFHTRSAYRFTLEDTIYIAPEAHRQGVGRKLLATLIDRCEAIGSRQMMALITQADDNTDSPSVALHKIMDFRPMGTARGVGYKFGRWIDVVYMQRSIGQGSTTQPDRSAPGQTISLQPVSL